VTRIIKFIENFLFQPGYFFELLSRASTCEAGAQINVWRYVMKAVTASVLLAVTVMAAPAFARSGLHNAAHRQGNPVYPVYQGNQYLGSDPDPQVQFDLEREAGSRNGGY
jgi:hypothetical protein